MLNIFGYVVGIMNLYPLMRIETLNESVDI